MQNTQHTDQAGTVGGGARRRRPLLASLTTLGVVAGLLGVAGVFAAGSDTATTGDNDVRSGALEQAEADLQLATGTFGFDDAQRLVTNCNDDWSDDLQSGVLTGVVDDGQEGVHYVIAPLCIRNQGTEAVSVDWSSFDVVDTEVECSPQEEADDCGTGGELSTHLTLDPGTSPADSNVCTTRPQVSVANLQSPQPLVELAPGEVAELCLHGLWDFDPVSQSDRVLFRLRFEASSGTTEPPADCVDDGFEENDSIATATPYTAPTTGQICADDLDHFAYEHPGGDLHALLQYESDEGDLDLRLLDAGGNWVTSAGSIDDDDELTAPDLAPGTYYLQVAGYEGAQAPYALTVDSIVPPPCADDEFEDNDSFGQAAPTTGHLTGTICSGDDDFFAYQHGGGELRVDLAFVDDVGDLDLEVLGPEGQTVGRSEGVDDTESVVIPAAGAPAGTYVVRVHGYQGDAGGYTLDIGGSIVAPPPGGGEDVGPLG